MNLRDLFLKVAAGVPVIALGFSASGAEMWITIGRTYFVGSGVIEVEQLDLSSINRRGGVVFARGKSTDFNQRLGASKKPVFKAWLADCQGDEVGFDEDSTPHGGRWLYGGERRWIDIKTGQVLGMENANEKRPAGVRPEFWLKLQEYSALTEAKMKVEPSHNVRFTKVFELLCGHPPGAKSAKPGVIR